MSSLTDVGAKSSGVAAILPTPQRLIDGSWPAPCRQMIESTTVPRGVEAEGIMKLASFETMLVLASLTMLALVVMGG
jgi:hypothetical protein